MKNAAFVFPGQGSQFPGMLASLSDEYPIIKDIFAKASSLLNKDLWQISQSGSPDELNSTLNAQPILLTAGYAVWIAWLKQGGQMPSMLAGHSLGEYTALTCAKALTFEDALELVVMRAKFMQEAVPIGSGAMLAIIGLDEAKVLEICRNASQETQQILTPANYNSIGQIVVAGEKKAAELAITLAKAAGAKIAKLLPMTVPSHCPLMAKAAESLQSVLNTVNVSKPEIPVIQNADVMIFDDPVKIKDALVRQLYNPVRWVETIKYMESKNIKTILECGPGKVLTGLNKRISVNIIVDYIGEPDNFKKYL